MKTYYQIQFYQIASILTLAAQGVSSVTGFKNTVSDMIYALHDLSDTMHSWSTRTPYYIAIRKQGTENGNKETCVDRCKILGYPIVIAKIEADRICGFNMTIKFACHCTDINLIEKEFNSL